ncbi:MAG: DUF2391 family protein [Candidatus Nanohaloarchaea archaeon]|nr:DUF2391 family protein [Candidatus Nanohaloarchaea archaeon]
MGVANRFRFADSAQQMVGGFLLAGPFVVTEEVWQLAAAMGPVNTGATTLIVLVIGYGALYRADRGRAVEDDRREPKVLGVPVRYLSLLLVSYGAVTVLALVLDAPATFGADLPTTVRAISVGAIFSIIGAATADSVF